MMKIPALKSGFALLDVKSGRIGLSKYFGQEFPKPIPVIIYGEITSQWGHDDGESIEFEVIVKKVKVKQ